MQFWAIQIEISWIKDGLWYNKDIYRYLERIRVWHWQINYYKEHFVLDIFSPEGARIKVRFYSPTKNRIEFLSYLKKYLKHEFDLDETTVPEDNPAYLTVGVKVYETVEKWLNRYAVNAQEKELIREIQKFQPDLTQDMILNLLQNYPRSEIIAWKWIRWRFYPAEIYSVTVGNIDLMDTGVEGSMM